jgi:hypothetical protein
MIFLIKCNFKLLYHYHVQISLIVHCFNISTLAAAAIIVIFSDELDSSARNSGIYWRILQRKPSHLIGDFDTDTTDADRNAKTEQWSMAILYIN